ncbi:MAG: hypothetical protein ACLS9K_01465 [Lachnospira eligens]
MECSAWSRRAYKAYTNAAKEALSVCRLGELTEGVHAFLDVDYNYVGNAVHMCTE